MNLIDNMGTLSPTAMKISHSKSYEWIQVAKRSFTLNQN